MVIYRGPDSKVGYHQTDDVHDAVSFVEQLRNDQGVEHARIFRLEEVTFEYRPYYRVELRSGPAIGAGSSTPEVAAPVVAERASTPEPEMAAAKVADSVPTAPVVEPVETAQSVQKEAVKTEPAKPVAETVVEPKVEEPPAAPTEPSNGVGARRGLFGR